MTAPTPAHALAARAIKWHAERRAAEADTRDVDPEVRARGAARLDALDVERQELRIAWETWNARHAALKDYAQALRDAGAPPRTLCAALVAAAGEQPQGPSRREAARIAIECSRTPRHGDDQAPSARVYLRVPIP